MEHYKKIRFATRRMKTWTTWLASCQTHLNTNETSDSPVSMDHIEGTICEEKYANHLFNLIEMQRNFIRARKKNAIKLEGHIENLEKRIEQLEMDTNLSKLSVQLNEVKSPWNEEEFNDYIMKIQMSNSESDSNDEIDNGDSGGGGGADADAADEVTPTSEETLRTPSHKMSGDASFTKRSKDQDRTGNALLAMELLMNQNPYETKQKNSTKLRRTNVQLVARNCNSSETMMRRHFKIPNTFSMPELLEINQKPNLDSDSSNPTPAQSQYRCMHCEKSCKSRKSLERHVQMQHWKAKYICNVCGVAYTMMNIYVEHLLSHNVQSKRQCPFCERAFKCPHTFRYHLLQHSGERPYRCRFCDRNFSVLSKCRLHIVKQHPDEFNICEKDGQLPYIVEKGHETKETLKRGKNQKIN